MSSGVADSDRTASIASLRRCARPRPSACAPVRLLASGGCAPSPAPARPGRRAGWPPARRRSARSSRRAGRRRSGRRRCREPGAQRLAGRHLAEAQDQVGARPSSRSARRAAAGRRRRRRGSGRGGRSGAARSARRGSGSRRRSARSASGSRSSGSSWRPGDDHARRSRRRCAPASSSSRNAPGSRSIWVDRGQRPLLRRPSQRQRIGRRHGPVDGRRAPAARARAG